MSALRTIVNLENEILAAAKKAARNSRLRKEDIMEWAFGEVRPLAGEVALRLESVGCHVCIHKSRDKRRKLAA
jgi:hypothetical protein